MALALHRTVGELEATLSHSEFLEWMEFACICPFGVDRLNFENASIKQVMYATHGIKTALKDCILEFNYKPPTQDELQNSLLAFAREHNAKISGQPYFIPNKKA